MVKDNYTIDVVSHLGFVFMVCYLKFNLYFSFQLKNKRTETVEVTRDALHESSVSSPEPAAQGDSDENISSQEIAAYIADIIDKAKQELLLEVCVISFIHKLLIHNTIGCIQSSVDVSKFQSYSQSLP